MKLNIKKTFLHYLLIFLICLPGNTTDKQEVLNLPHEILIHTFRNLPLESICNTSKVCHSWNILTKDHSLWNDRQVTNDAFLWKNSTLLPDRKLQIFSTFLNSYPIKNLHLSCLTSNNDLIDNFLKIIETSINKLNYLKIENICLGHNVAKKISSFLLGNRSIKSLCIIKGNIGDLGIKSLAEALEGNTVLTSLSLRGNMISAIGVTYLSDMLTRNRTLLYLDVGENYIRNDGVKSLITAINKNKILKYLGIESNEINYEGASFIKNNLINNNLIKIYVRGNYIDLEDNIITKILKYPIN
jgi:hypothetical protein